MYSIPKLVYHGNPMTEGELRKIRQQIEEKGWRLTGWTSYHDAPAYTEYIRFGVKRNNQNGEERTIDIDDIESLERY